MLGVPINKPGAASRWRSLIEAAVAKLWETLADGPAWVEAQVEQESAGDPHARSASGAVGLLQLMPGTAKDMGLIVVLPNGTDQRLDPAANLYAGVRYLHLQHMHFPEIAFGLDRLFWSFAAYNCGRGYCNKALSIARNRGVSNWATWVGSAHFLGDPQCVVSGRHPDAKQVWDYVAKIRERFAKLTGKTL